jgi:methylglutaconyl-CoA hydratase
MSPQSNKRGKGLRVLILTSDVDSSFCAGADLKERAASPNKSTSQILVLSHQNENSPLLVLEQPTSSSPSQNLHLALPPAYSHHNRLSSLAFGGGLELALTTNLRVFASTASVALPETRLGIVPGAGGTYRLPALIGLNRARDLILTGRRVGGAEAYFLGFVTGLLRCSLTKYKLKEELGASVGGGEVSEELCEGAPLATRAALRAVNGWRDGEEVENAAYDEVLATEDRNEALRAFREKRSLCSGDGEKAGLLRWF